MGLDVSHDAWHGPYSQFMRWRTWLARQVGIPLQMMHGFFRWEFTPEDAGMDGLAKRIGLGWDKDAVCTRDLIDAAAGATPIPWFDHPLRILLSHSDCDGRIRWWECKRLAMELLKVYRQTVGKDVPGHGPEVHRGCYDSMRAATLRFALGAMRAWKARKDLRFG